MATTAALTENSRQGIDFQIPHCIGPAARLSPNPRWGCSHRYDETAVGLVVYVRNDPVNLVDPDGKRWRFIADQHRMVINDYWETWYTYDFWWEDEGGGGLAGGDRIGGEIGGGIAESQQDQLNGVLKTLKSIAEKKDCAAFLNGIFGYASTNYQGKFGEDYASIAGVTSLAQNAQYHIATPGDTTITPGGVNVGEKLAVPGSGTYTRAFVERGQNVVYVGQGAFSDNLGTTLLHEALHISYYDPNTQKFVGFGLSDTELATAVGAYKEGMTNDQASLAFSARMEKKCR